MDDDGFDMEAELKKLEIIVMEGDAKRKQGSFKLIRKYITISIYWTTMQFITFILLSFLVEKEALKKMGSGLCVILIVVMSGTFTFETYASHVFKESNANFDANLSAIIMSILQICGTCISSLLIDSLGRRKMFGFSSIFSGFALIVFGIFSYLEYRGMDMTSLYWLPVTSLSFFIFVNSAGMRQIPIVYTTEILPENVSKKIAALCKKMLEIDN